MGRMPWELYSRKLLFLLLTGLVFFFCGGLAAQETDTTRQLLVDRNATSRQEFLRLRGLEKDRPERFAPLRTAANVLLFVPRTVFSGVLYTTGYGPHLIDDSEFVERFESFLYFYQKQIGWYPVAAFSSGTSLAYGAGVFYRQKPFGISAGGYYHSSNLWKAKIKLLNAYRIGRSVLQFNLSGSILTRDDYKFHGFGADPARDSRNQFQNDSPYGIYLQRLGRLQLIVGFRPSDNWQFFYSGFYQERKIENPGDDDPANIRNVFDLSQIPGIAPGGPTIGKQLYNELSARFDTRAYQGQLSPGVLVEGYLGFSQGVGGDRSRFARAGGLAALFIPVIKHNRLITPRVVLDVIDNRNDGAPISFAEYPRQPTFRGISSKQLLRTDNVSLVSSLEYKWPLTFNVGGHLFVDYLFAGDSIDKLTFRQAPYAIGFGFDVHGEDSELARISVAGGSEGLRFKLTVGLSGYSTARTDWQ